MTISEIKVSAGRTFNHPYESYSNLRPSIELIAILDDNDDADACAKALQAKAERLVEDHKTHLLESLRGIEEMQRRDQEVASLERQIAASQRRLEQVRQEATLLPAASDSESASF